MAQAGSACRLSGPRDPWGGGLQARESAGAEALSIGGGRQPPQHSLLNWPGAEEARPPSRLEDSSPASQGAAKSRGTTERKEGRGSLQMGKLRAGEETASLERWERWVLTLPSVHAPLTWPAASLLLCFPPPHRPPPTPRGAWKRLLAQFNWVQETQGLTAPRPPLSVPQGFPQL